MAYSWRRPPECAATSPDTLATADALKSIRHAAHHALRGWGADHRRPVVCAPCSPAPWCNGVVKLRCGMALGASPRRVARSIVMESLVLAGAGGTIGIVGAAASSRLRARCSWCGTAGSRHARDGRCRAPGGGRGCQLVAGATCRGDRPRARDERRDVRGSAPPAPH
jgi:hypothetical protein